MYYGKWENQVWKGHTACSSYTLCCRAAVTAANAAAASMWLCPTFDSDLSETKISIKCVKCIVHCAMWVGMNLALIFVGRQQAQKHTHTLSLSLVPFLLNTVHTSDIHDDDDSVAKAYHIFSATSMGPKWKWKSNLNKNICHENATDAHAHRKIEKKM